MEQIDFFEQEIAKEPHEQTIPQSLRRDYESSVELDQDLLDIRDQGNHWQVIGAVVRNCVKAGVKEVTFSYSNGLVIETLAEMLKMGCRITGTQQVKKYKLSDGRVRYCDALTISLPVEINTENCEVDNTHLYFCTPNKAQKERIAAEQERQRRIEQRNKVHLIGHIEKPPLEQMTKKSGIRVVRYTVQVESDRRDWRGRPAYEYAECVSYGNTAEVFEAGTLIELEGTLHSIISKTKDGREYRRMEVLVEAVWKLDTVKTDGAAYAKRLVRR